jgi:hypothetical protein
MHRVAVEVANERQKIGVSVMISTAPSMKHPAIRMKSRISSMTP